MKATDVKALHLALTLTCSTLLGATALLATAVPAAAQPAAAVNGWIATFVRFGGGHYARLPDGSWAEFDLRGQVTFRFAETQRDEWSVYLHDASRNVQIQLDLFRRKISYGTNGGPRSDLYDITGASDGGAPADRPAPAPPPLSAVPALRLRMVNAGPIWNQPDAQAKCPVVAYAVDGRWTGQWRTIREGQMSVCEIAD
jgi:Mannan-binding protein